MRLRSGARDIELTTRFVPHDISGDDAIECMLVAGPSRDFNAMFRRGRARGRVVVVRAGDAEFGPAPFRLAYAAAGSHECTIAGHAPLRLPEGHALLVDATDAGSEGVPVAVRPVGTAQWRWLSASRPMSPPGRPKGEYRSAKREGTPVRLFAADALTPRGWLRDVGYRYRCRWHDRAGRAECAARWSGARGRPTVAGRAEPALACVSAGACRTHGTRERERRLVLDVAARDVRISRPDRCRRIRGDRGAGVCRDAEGRIHGGRRIPLCSSRSAGQTLRRSGGARASHHRCGGHDGHRAHAAPGFLRARRFRRRAAHRGPAAVRAYGRFLRARRGVARARCRPLRVETRDRAAQLARRDSGRARGDRRSGAARGADPHSRGRTAKRGCGVCDMERRAAGRMAAGARGTRCALVRRARDAHDGRRNTAPRCERRDRRSRADNRGGSGRRHLCRAFLPRCAGRVRRRQRLEHLHRSVRRVAATRVVAAAVATSAQCARGRRRAGRAGALRRGGARRSDGAGPSDGRHCPGMPRRSRRARYRRSRAGRPARRGRCSMPRCSARAVPRCAT